MDQRASIPLPSNDPLSEAPVILIVEDEPTIAGLFETLLRMEGFRPLIAPRTSIAIQRLDEMDPDAVILDVMMPGMSGLEVCRHVRDHPRHRGVPVIIVSARAQEDDINAGYQAGADVYLKKPISNRKLVETVRKYVSEGRSPKPGSKTPAGLSREIEGAILEVKRYLAEITRSQQAYQSIAEELERTNGRPLSETQQQAREAVEHYRRQIRQNQAASWQVLEGILTRLELKDAAIRKRGSHQPRDRESWQLASSRAPFVKEDCHRWAAEDPSQILREYQAALADEDGIYAYLLERYGQMALEASDRWHHLSELQSRIVAVSEPDPAALEEVRGYYDRLNPLRANLAGIRPPDALVLIERPAGEQGNEATPLKGFQTKRLIESSNGKGRTNGGRSHAPRESQGDAEAGLPADLRSP